LNGGLVKRTVRDQVILVVVGQSYDYACHNEWLQSIEEEEWFEEWLKSIEEEV
jgi:hypothetical protein